MAGTRRTVPPPPPPTLRPSNPIAAKAVRTSFPPDLPAKASKRERTIYERRQLRLYEQLLGALYEAVVVTDHAKNVTHFNAAAERLFDRTADAVMGTDIFGYFYTEGEEPGLIADRIDEGQSVRDMRVLITRPDGVRAVALLSVMPIYIGNHLVRVVGVFRDMTEIERVNEKLEQANQELKRLNDELKARAMIDEKTGLLNERALRAELQRARASAHRYGETLAVFYFDLTRFKALNDTYGHAAGDRVIVEFALRLRELVYATDIVARIHGDEFVVIVPKTVSDESELAARIDPVAKVELAARRIAANVHLRMSFMNPKTEVVESVSVHPAVGYVVRTGKNIPSEDELLRLADQAMYEAKRLNKLYVGDTNDSPASILPGAPTDS